MSPAIKLPSGEDLMLHRVRAVNHSTLSENRIHDDQVARSHGFGGGLVPGVTVFAYMTHPVVEAHGLEWFERGLLSVRFDRPVYDGDSVEVTATPEDGSLALTVTTESGACARGRSGLRAQRVAPPRLEEFPLLPLPAGRPAADATSLAPGRVLGAVEIPVESAVEAGYRAEVGEDLPLYAGERLMHPGRLLHGCNLCLSQNVLMGPWIHTGSEVSIFSPAREGETVELRPRVQERFEKKGHQFVVLEVLAIAQGRAVMHCLHTAIYELRRP
jgi:acyl dehydratase